MRTRGWKRQWEKLGLKVTMTDMKTTEVDLDIAKDGGSSITDAKTRSVRGTCFWQPWWKALSGSSYLSFTNSRMCTHTQRSLCCAHSKPRTHICRATRTHETYIQNLVVSYKTTQSFCLSLKHTLQSTFHKHPTHTYLTQTNRLCTKLVVCLTAACTSWTVVTSLLIILLSVALVCCNAAGAKHTIRKFSKWHTVIRPGWSVAIGGCFIPQMGTQ